MTSGEPEAIHGLAGAFESAAREAASATEAGARASLQTGEAYRVDGNEVHAVNVESGRTRELLGGGGEDLERIGRILRGVGDDLAAKSGTAVQKVLQLEEELRRLQNDFAEYEASYQAALASEPPVLTMYPLDHYRELNEQYASEQQAFRDRSTDAAQRTGREIQGLVSEYDAMLGGRAAELADLGYTVPGGVNQGPGDVESDPNAGRSDAQAVAEALDLDPSAQSEAMIDAATGQIRAINDKVANGETLTDQERAYLNQFYETLGADNLALLPEHLAEANANSTSGAPSNVLEQMTEDDLRPFGDSIMNLSNVPGATYESLPAPVRDLLDTRLGHFDPDTGWRHLNPRIGGPYPEGTSDPTAYVLNGGVTGMNRFRAISDILGSSDVAPGRDLTFHLVDNAIQARQDLNDMYYMSGEDRPLTLSEGDHHDYYDTRVAQLIDDSAASDMLSVAARNNDTSSYVLMDADRRAAILGLNWEDATGAAALVDAGTTRDASAGGGSGLQAQAARDVVLEVGDDRGIIARDEDSNVVESTGYLGRMADPVKDAVVDAGAQYMEVFADPGVDGSHTGMTSERTNALDNPVNPSFTLTPEERDRFLQFVSGTGDDRAAEFQTHAQGWAQTELTNALIHGDPGQVERAMEMAGWLDGKISQANFDYTADQVAAGDAAASVEHRAQTLDARATQGAYNNWAAAGKEIGGFLASAVPGGSATLSVLTEMVKGEIGVHTLAPSAPPPELSQELQDMRREDSEWVTFRRDLALAQAMDAAGVFDGSSRPEILNHDGEGDVDAPWSSTEDLSNLGSDVRDGLDRWSTEWHENHPESGMSRVIDPEIWTDKRGDIEDWDGGDDWKTPDDSAWHENRLYYGENMPPGLIDPRQIEDAPNPNDPEYWHPRR